MSQWKHASLSQFELEYLIGNRSTEENDGSNHCSCSQDHITSTMTNAGFMKHGGWDDRHAGKPVSARHHRRRCASLH